MQTGNSTSFWFGDDYCHCRRCPCCGKLVSAPYTPYNPYFTYTTSPYFYGYNYTPNVVAGGLGFDPNQTTFTVTVDGKKK